MTLEQLINEYNAVSQQLVELQSTTRAVTETRNTLERRIAAQIAISPGGKLFHLPSGIVYTTNTKGELSVFESLYTTRDVTVTDDTTPAEDAALAANWARNGHVRNGYHHQGCS